jgi:hypothetical protein
MEAALVATTAAALAAGIAAVGTTVAALVETAVAVLAVGIAGAVVQEAVIDWSNAHIPI